MVVFMNILPPPLLTGSTFNEQADTFQINLKHCQHDVGRQGRSTL